MASPSRHCGSRSASWTAAAASASKPRGQDDSADARPRLNVAEEWQTAKGAACRRPRASEVSALGIARRQQRRRRVDGGFYAAYAETEDLRSRRQASPASELRSEAWLPPEYPLARDPHVARAPPAGAAERGRRERFSWSLRPWSRRGRAWACRTAGSGSSTPCPPQRSLFPLSIRRHRLRTDETERPGSCSTILLHLGRLRQQPDDQLVLLRLPRAHVLVDAARHQRTESRGRWSAMACKHGAREHERGA